MGNPHSDHRMLAHDQLTTLVEALAEVIESHGGEIQVAYEAHLYLARRAV